MSYRDELDKFAEKHPFKRLEAGGAEFEYVLEGDENAPALVFLNGGMNISLMWMKYVELLSDEFRVLIFDYPQAAGTNAELVEAMDEFFEKLRIKKPLLIGASDGGIVAQLYTQKYPEKPGGLVIISTGALDRESIKEYKRKYFLAPLLIWHMKRCNYDKMKKQLIKVGEGFGKGESEEDKAYIKDMFTELFRDYAREKDIHITGLLADILNQSPVTEENFAALKGKILLILPDRDFFSAKIQQRLVSLMHSPGVIYISGGHMSTVLRAEEYAGEIRRFAKEKI